MSEVRFGTPEELVDLAGRDAVGLPLVNAFGELRAWEVLAKGECLLVTVAQWDEYKRICDWRRN